MARPNFGFLLGLFFEPEEDRDVFLKDVRYNFNRLHGVISQKVQLFITTAVRNTNPT
jgi:hypothetical protein